MELEDCAFPLVEEVKIGADPYELFADVDSAFLVGAKPRGPGMERKDLLRANGSIFSKQGAALNSVAKKNVRVLVVGNPCNTNCLIAIHHAPSLPSNHFAALTRLDENRGRGLLAITAERSVGEVSQVVIWGNHSSTLVPDTTYTLVGKKRAADCFDASWLASSFISQIRQRGAEVIKCRGKSSAASAGWAAAEAMRVWYGQPEENRIFSMAVYSEHNPYGIDSDLVFSFPCRMRGKELEIAPNLKPSEELWQEVIRSEEELKAEREMVRDLFPKRSKTAA